MGGLTSVLEASGFSGSTDCNRDELAIRYVGEVRKLGRAYNIYANRYSLRPACAECAVHGGQRIIVMENGRYIGQYRSDFLDVSIRNSELVFLRTDMSGAQPVTVQFSAEGPPARQWDGGEVLLLFK